MKVLLLILFVIGLLAGLVLQGLNEIETRKLAANASETDFRINQNRKFNIFNSFDATFNLCLEFCNSYPVKISSENLLTGRIEAKTGIDWKNLGWTTFGHKLQFNLTKVTESLIEVEVLINPKMPITLLDSGKGLKIINSIEDFFNSANDGESLYELIENTEIPIDFYTEQIDLKK